MVKQLSSKFKVYTFGPYERLAEKPKNEVVMTRFAEIFRAKDSKKLDDEKKMNAFVREWESKDLDDNSALITFQPPSRKREQMGIWVAMNLYHLYYPESSSQPITFENLKKFAKRYSSTLIQLGRETNYRHFIFYELKEEQDKKPNRFKFVHDANSVDVARTKKSIQETISNIEAKRKAIK